MTGYLALGANLGDRRASLAAAVLALDESEGIRVMGQSRGYATVPEGQARLRGWGPYAVVHHLATATPDDAVALSMKPAVRMQAELSVFSSSSTSTRFSAMSLAMVFSASASWEPACRAGR